MPNIFARSEGSDSVPAHDGASDIVEKVTADKLDLAKNPRRVVVVGSVDSFEYEFKDDGGAVVDGAFEPNAYRQNLMAALTRPIEKGPCKGIPAFFLKEPYRLFPGDPLASFPTMKQAHVQKVVEQATATRNLHLQEATEFALAEAEKAKLQFQQAQAKAQGLASPAAPAAKPEVKK